MQYILQNTKRLISICLVTLLVIASALTILPTPARADDCTGLVTICPSANLNLDNQATFAVGVVTGSAVTLAATGGGNAVAAAGTTAIVDVATTLAAPLATVAVTAAPIAAPVAVGAAVVGGGYLLWQLLSQASVPEQVQGNDSAK